jgi:hypothetical protein
MYSSAGKIPCVALESSAANSVAALLWWLKRLKDEQENIFRRWKQTWYYFQIQLLIEHDELTNQVEEKMDDVEVNQRLLFLNIVRKN